ncbi:MAG: tRNA guanosine(34) transglycosylase Tgt [Candidatus Gottesmanbacteria bacterium]|nr:tRNA guanosine(34) transglycosylase Tgt [Candidatus Gottesmanbacteria bacterium]
MKDFQFKIICKGKKTKARVGEIYTPHGVIKTPAFVPVGTQASVKSVTPEELATLGTQIFFVNTYHMYLRPGIEVVEKLGGLHKFMGWDGPIITDSGGFQVFSLGRDKKFGNRPLDQITSSSRHDTGNQTIKPDQLVKITDDGVEFRSHWDGSKHLFTPESAMEWQWKLGSDIHIAFDDCTSYPVAYEVAKKSMERTHRWAARSLTASQKLKVESQKSGEPYQALYGSIQGSVFEDLRRESAQYIAAMDFDGVAIGGVAVGETKKEMVHVLDWVVPILPEEKPRHLLGVGEIDDIFAAVERGIDTFDCVQPTRLGRVGIVLIGNTTPAKRDLAPRDNNPINKYKIDITNKCYAEDRRPIEEGCQCYTCTHFARAYIHHLFRVRELLGYRLATIHNLWFVHQLMTEIREAIVEGKLLELKKKWL